MSLANSNPKFSSVPNSLDDEALVSHIANDAMRRSNLSREQIAEQMSQLTGKQITTAMLYHWTGKSSIQNRWPLCYTRAFCQVVNDWRLLSAIAELGNLKVISAEESLFLDLGRRYFDRKKTDAQLHELETLIASGRIK